MKGIDGLRFKMSQVESSLNLFYVKAININERNIVKLIFPKVTKTEYSSECLHLGGH